MLIPGWRKIAITLIDWIVGVIAPFTTITFSYAGSRLKQVLYFRVDMIWEQSPLRMFEDSWPFWGGILIWILAFVLWSNWASDVGSLYP